MPRKNPQKQGFVQEDKPEGSNIVHLDDSRTFETPKEILERLEALNQEESSIVDLTTQKGQFEATGGFLVEAIFEGKTTTIIPTTQALTHRSIAKLIKWSRKPGSKIDPTAIKILKTPTDSTVQKPSEKETEQIDTITGLIGQDFEELRKETKEHKKIIKEDIVNILDIQKGKFEINPEIEKLLKGLMEVITNEGHLTELTLLNILREDEKHEETTVHSVCIALLNILFGNFLMQNHPKIAQGCGLNSKKDLIESGVSGILHDVGKILINKDTLYKEGKITKEEKDYIDTHAKLGGKILKGVYRRVACEHHDKAAKNSHPFSKITHITDVFGALTQTRSYRNAMLPIEAMFIQIEDYLNESYDHELFKLFYQFIINSKEPILKQGLVFKLPFSKCDEIKRDFGITAFATPEEKAQEIQKDLCASVKRTNGHVADCSIFIRTQQKDPKTKQVIQDLTTYEPLVDKTGKDIKLMVMLPQNLKQQESDLNTKLENVARIYQLKE